jgi:hypothetical protein
MLDRKVGREAELPTHSHALFWLSKEGLNWVLGKLRAGDIEEPIADRARARAWL